jgi:RNA polymerase sigma-70 factor (ECF subfamily)
MPPRAAAPTMNGTASRPADVKVGSMTQPGPAADESFIADLYAQHGSALLSYVRHLGAGHHDAEDVVQETMLRAWGHIHALDPQSGTIRGWLFTVARHILIDRVRLKSAIPAGFDPGGAQPPVADHQAALAERIDAVSALARLTPEHRSAVVAVYFRDHTVDSAARSLGVPAGTVKSRLHYGLRQLRVIYEAECGAEDKRSRPRLTGALV